MSEPTPPAVDPSMLAELLAVSGDGESTLLDEMIDLFTEDSLKRLDALGAAVRSGDGVEVAEVAHSLKGSCSNFGAHLLEKKCKELELAARAGNFAQVVVSLDEVAREVNRVLAALEQARS